MSRKNQNNDSQDESLNDEQKDVSANDQALEDEQAPEEKIETADDAIEEVEDIYEKTAGEKEEDVDPELPQDQQPDQDLEQDQGFEQQPVAPMSQSGSGGKGMAGTAMGLSLLALAGTGYNMFSSKSPEPVDDGTTEQAAVDYSVEIASIQQQIVSLMQSQEELTAMATASQTQQGAGSGEVEQVAATDASAVQDDSAGQSTDTSESSAGVGESAQADTAESTTGEADEQVTDEQAAETEAVAQQDADSAQDSTASAAETVDTDSADSEMAEAESTDTDTADTESTGTETANIDSTDSEMADAEYTDTEMADAESTDTEMADAESVDTGTVAETAVASEQDQQTDSQGDTTSMASAESEIKLGLDQQAQVQAQVDALTSNLPSGDEIKKMAMEQVSVVLDDARKRLGLNEVAQLLSIGEQRLALAGDVGGARAAFGMAQQRISEISDPLVEPVRESISNNLAELESLEVVDKNALTQELADLSESVDTLAFKPLETLSESSADEQQQAQGTAESAQEAEQTASSETQSGGDASSLEGAGKWLKSFGSKVGSTIGDVGSGIAGDLKGMVTIQKTGPLSDVLLAPEQQYFVRENIKLQLGSAQRAVLQDNTAVYKQSLAQAQSFLNDFFDTENDDVKSVSTRLNDLQQINLELELPDVSAASASLSEVLKQLPSVGSSETNSN